jgi:hypothetical protein
MAPMRRERVYLAVLLAAALALAAPLAGVTAKPKPKPKRTPPPFLTFRVFAETGLPLSDITWTGERFLYATETLGTFSVGGPGGAPLAPFATIPSEVEEVRCRPSPAARGWPAGFVYCHAPHGVVYRLAQDGTTAVFATIPETDKQDGVIAFDTLGEFGYAMLVTTGGPAGDGGTVYAFGPDAAMRRIGSFPGPGGADNIELAPPEFGLASRELLIAIDYDPGGGAPGAGRVLAMRPDGSVRTLVNLPEGINPIAVIGRGDAPRGTAMPGLYVTDALSTSVYFLPASVLATRYPSTVIVGSEKTAHFWLVRPNATGFAQLRLKSNLEAMRSTWNLEGGEYVP